LSDSARFSSDAGRSGGLRLPVACVASPQIPYRKTFHANRGFFSAWRRFFVLRPKKRFRRRQNISAVMMAPERVF